MPNNSSKLIKLLDEYVQNFYNGESVDDLKNTIYETLEYENNVDTFETIANESWEKYFCVNVEVMISILRRWLSIVPDSVDAKHALGNYMLAHGPDWDNEANELLEE